MSNYGSYTGFGVMLTPSGEEEDPVYIQAADAGLEMGVDVTAEIFQSPFRVSPMVVLGKRHMHSGEINGLLIDRSEDGTPGSTITAKAWADRLFYMVRHQGDPELDPIALDSEGFQATRVAFAERYTITARKRKGGIFYEVSVPWWELEED